MKKHSVSGEINNRKKGFFAKLTDMMSNGGQQDNMMMEGMNKESIKAENMDEELVCSPMKGQLVPLENIKDEAFSSGLLGKGVAIMPIEGKVFAPLNGTLTNVLPSGHALGITSDNGIEVLIHIGQDTVKLKGQHFKPIAKQGQQVKKGDLLLEFDINSIQAAGFDLTTPIIISNTFNFPNVLVTDKEAVDIDEKLLVVTIK